MEIENTTQGTENGNTDLASLRGELESLKAMNQDLLTKVSQIVTPPEATKKPLTKEEFAELFKEHPDQAIDLALENKVSERVTQIEHKLNTKQQREYFDRKAQQDFPPLEKDAEFQKKVKAKVAELVSEGEYVKDSPKLVYRACQLASMEYKEKPKATEPERSISSEAPTNVKRDPKGHYKKKDSFETLSSIFGLSKESKDRLQKKMRG